LRVTARQRGNLAPITAIRVFMNDNGVFPHASIFPHWPGTSGSRFVLRTEAMGTEEHLETKVVHINLHEHPR
jgi:hypothetical protein